MLFIANRYTNLYAMIVHRAKTDRNRSKGNGIYYENHHIVPRSLGGSNDSENLVLLTAKEHYTCHRLLVKMLDGKNRYLMLSALNFLQGRHQRGGYSYNGRKFKRDREAAWKTGENHPLKGKPRTDAEAHAKRLEEINKTRVRTKHSDETKAKMSASHKRRDNRGDKNPSFGKLKTLEQKEHLSKINAGENNPFYGKQHSIEFRERNRGETHAMFGKTHSLETRAKIREAIAGKQTGENNHRYGVKLSEKQKEQMRISSSGRIWVNNGEKQRLLKDSELSTALSNGWIKGRVR